MPAVGLALPVSGRQVASGGAAESWWWLYTKGDCSPLLQGLDSSGEIECTARKTFFEIDRTSCAIESDALSL